MVGYKVYEKGVLIGFSLPFLKNTPWHKMLERHDSFARKSSVVRVKLVVELARHIRAIQAINLCHGDMHIGNIVMHVDEK